jgi:hypothetical protein
MWVKRNWRLWWTKGTSDILYYLQKWLLSVCARACVCCACVWTVLRTLSNTNTTHTRARARVCVCVCEHICMQPSFFNKLCWTKKIASGLLHCVVWWTFTDISEMLAASIIRAVSKLYTRNPVQLAHHLDGGGSKHLWNVTKLLPDYTAQQPRTQSTTFLLLWEPQFSIIERIEMHISYATRQLNTCTCAYFSLIF